MTMLPTLRSLTTNRELALQLLTPEEALPAGALDAPIAWVHSSDLADPTPFLSPGQVLLTTGTQFGGQDDDELIGAYVERLSAAGISGLGFGTEVVRAGTPDALVEACRLAGLPAFEVPYRTPFIAVARAAADMAAEERFARRSWTLAAHRAIALAALRPDGLSASLHELSLQLDRWVALFDANGGLDRVFPAEAAAAASAAEDEATRLLRRGNRASSSLAAGGETVSLQTLGRRDRLRGVLAIGGSSELDAAGNEVVTAVIALAGLSLEQGHTLDRAQSSLRSAVLAAWRRGDVELAQSVSREMWGELPESPVCIALLDAPAEKLHSVTEYLEARVAEQPGALFFAADPSAGEDRIALVLGQKSLPLLDAVAANFAVHIGVSEPRGASELAGGLTQAEQALARAQDGGPGVSAFSELAQEGVLAYLSTTDAREIGRATLQPLRAHDEAAGSELLHTLRVWLEQNGQFDASAGLLGVHRHTVRARIGLAERLLGRDLSTFRGRAEIWAALLVAGDEPPA
ncbi:PucR family transcriptional regulator [Microterricola viridarii]|uniref:Purine catabolism regulatory protein n=1 Tax=Microterricola viridarii TaxID=412690 RepID=A0A1H1LCB7_9MICO|nr:PucR family transcriptional regulator [Microterricola viridarii]SDR72204.1 purine catabolism regulatory protein [Microterricola viridarii]